MRTQKGIRGALSLTLPIDGLGAQGHDSVISPSGIRKLRRLAGFQISCGQVRVNVPPPSFETRTFQALTRLYTG